MAWLEEQSRQAGSAVGFEQQVAGQQEIVRIQQLEGVLKKFPDEFNGMVDALAREGADARVWRRGTAEPVR